MPLGDTPISRWLEFLSEEAKERGYNIEQQGQRKFKIIDGNTVCCLGVVRVRKSWKYAESIEKQVFYDISVERNLEKEYPNREVLTIILDLYNRQDPFEVDVDHFILVNKNARSATESASNDNGAFYLRDPARGGSYYYTHSEDTGDQHTIACCDWDMIFTEYSATVDE